MMRKVVVSALTVFLIVLIVTFMMSIQGCSVWRVIAQQAPLEAHCSAECFGVCSKIPKWGDGNRDTEDALLKLARLVIKECEARRGACAQCLDRLKESKVIL